MTGCRRRAFLLAPGRVPAARGVARGDAEAARWVVEAAAQGLLAAINAVQKIREQDAWTPRRDEAYIGVLIDAQQCLKSLWCGLAAAHEIEAERTVRDVDK